MFEELGNYLSIVLDYSVVFEFSNGVWFDELTNLFEDKGIDCYIDDTFKILHKCVVQHGYEYAACRSYMQYRVFLGADQRSPYVLHSYNKKRHFHQKTL